MKRTLKFCLLSISLALASALAGCGYGGDGPDGVSASSSAQSKGRRDGEDFSPQDYVLTEEVSWRAWPEERPASALAVSIPAGTELTVIERREQPGRGKMVRLGIDADEDFPFPTDIWVSEEEIDTAVLLPYSLPDEPLDEQPEEGEDSAGDDRDSFRRRMTYCYRYVKLYLLKTGKVKVYLPGGSAYQAAAILPRHGFRRTGNGPATAAEGEVCVYAGGRHGHGHIEVKRSGRWWYGYGFKTRPIANRRLLGCFYK